jgi:hypothetical protein
MCLQQAIEQSQKQHETDLVEKNRLIRMLDDKVLSMYIICSIDRLGENVFFSLYLA